jgi:hypothetical protein
MGGNHDNASRSSSMPGGNTSKYVNKKGNEKKIANISQFAVYL